MGVLLIAIAVLVFITTGVVAVLDLHTALLLIPARPRARSRWSRRRSCSVGAAGWCASPTTATASSGSAGWASPPRGGRTSRTPSRRRRRARRSSYCACARARRPRFRWSMLAGDRDEFVRDLQRHLQRGAGPATALTGCDSATPDAASNLVLARPSGVGMEASPSPVYGARLLSGFGATTPSRVQIPPPPPHHSGPPHAGARVHLVALRLRNAAMQHIRSRKGGAQTARSTDNEP